MITNEMWQRAKRTFGGESFNTVNEIHFAYDRFFFSKIVAERVAREYSSEVTTITRKQVEEHFKEVEPKEAEPVFTKEDMCNAFIEGKSYGKNNPIMADEWLMDYMKESK